MDIHRSSIKNYILPKVKSVYVIDYYEGIQGILSGREDFNFKELLANPRVRTQNEIIWSTEAFSHRPVLLISLHGAEKERYSYLLNQCIHSVEYLINVLKAEDGGEPLCELLTKTIPYIDESSVYCGDGKIVLVNWGLIPRTQNNTAGQIYRSGKFIGNWDKTYYKPPVIKTAITESVPVQDAVGEDNPTNIDDVSISGNKLSYPTMPDNEERYDINDIANGKFGIANTVDSNPIEVASDTKSMESPKDITVEKDSKSESNNESEKQESVKASDTQFIKKEKDDKNEYDWGTLIANFWQGFKFLFRKLLWIILFAALFFLIMFLFKDCQGPFHKINPYYNPLPENPTVQPIEDSHVGLNADSTTYIATDRLNILLEQENENTMLEWAKAFKGIYDKEQYEIIYYNKDLGTLQIRVPDNERESIMKNLPDEIPQFRFEVFEETVMGSNEAINDPMLSNPENSWYLNPIGAKQAWDITLGEEDVVIAVIDNGFDTRHPELSGKSYNSYNVLTRNDYLRPIYTKDGIDAHGTHVAATAAGNYNNNAGLLGIAPKCKLMLIQVGNDNLEGWMSTTAIREGVLYAINQGADVINLSLGMHIEDKIKKMSDGEQLNFISSSFRQEEILWNYIYSKAKKSNSTIVYAAGNENVIAGIDPKKRSKDVINVSAINKELNKASFSNYGVFPELNREYSTLSAPGVSIYSAAPDNQYVSYNGTSMAAPIVSGAIALLKSIDNNLTTEQSIAILKKTGKYISSNIGPMINIGKALLTLKNDTVVHYDCDRIKKEIENLKARIDSLARICPDAAEPADTLKYSEAIKDKHGLDGVWKSTTGLVASSDNTPVNLYMSFRKLKGKLTIENKGKEYTATLNATIKKGKIHIVQEGPATNGKESFSKYVYECVADRKGYLQCTATSINNKVIFNLVKIK